MLSTDLALSPVDRLLNRPNALRPPMLMKLLLGRKPSSRISFSSSTFGSSGAGLDGNSVGRNTAGTYKGRIWRVM
jgi:hypothetical protein